MFSPNGQSFGLVANLRRGIRTHRLDAGVLDLIFIVLSTAVWDLLLIANLPQQPSVLPDWFSLVAICVPILLHASVEIISGSSFGKWHFGFQTVAKDAKVERLGFRRLARTAFKYSSPIVAICGSLNPPKVIFFYSSVLLLAAYITSLLVGIALKGQALHDLWLELEVIPRLKREQPRGFEVIDLNDRSENLDERNLKGD